MGGREPEKAAARVSVIGAGPAGITAAVQLSRFGIETTVFDGGAPGGLVANAYLVENYPGFPGGIRGCELAALFAAQLKSSGARLRTEEVVSLEYGGGFFRTVTQRGVLETSVAVIASGTRGAKAPGLELPGEVVGAVHFEASPLLSGEGMKVAVIGGGDAAFDYALSLSRRNDVTVVCRSSSPKCLPMLLRRCEENARISVMAGAGLLGVSKAGSGKRERLILGLSGPAGSRKLAADALLFAVGRDPCVSFLGPGVKGLVDSLVGAGSLHLVGDVVNGRSRQVSIAVGDGMRAAMNIYAYLNGGRRHRKRDDGSAPGGKA